MKPSVLNLPWKLYRAPDGLMPSTEIVVDEPEYRRVVQDLEDDFAYQERATDPDEPDTALAVAQHIIALHNASLEVVVRPRNNFHTEDIERPEADPDEDVDGRREL